MTLLEIPSEQIRERSIPVLETERLVLRAPRLGDAKAVAMLANDRRIAENTARIPHPYRMGDAEDFIALANRASETIFLITLRNGTVIGRTKQFESPGERTRRRCTLVEQAGAQLHPKDAPHGIVQPPHRDLAGTRLA